jgi:hypothetical protein
MKRVLNILLVLVLFSCNNNKIIRPQKPDNLMSKNKMVAVLYDMSLLNAAKGSNKKILENKGIYPRNFVFEKHKIDSLQFTESNNYYAFKPKVYEEIYERVRLKLKKEKDTYQAILDTEKKERDSIAKIKKIKQDSIKKVNKKKIDSLKKAQKGKFKIPIQKTKGLLKKASKPHQ